MSDYKRQPPGYECPPVTKNPADQPQPPGGGTCADLPTTTPPEFTPPTCPPTDQSCKCPPKPGSTPTCLQNLIADQAGQIATAEKAKAFKADLEALLAKANAASQTYTKSKYDELLKEWIKQDAAIAELIRQVVCAVPCWRCIIECYVCPLLNDMQIAERSLYGKAASDANLLYNSVKNLYDLQYWHSRDKDIKERRFNRIKTVLAAWEKPAQTIEKALADNKALHDAILKSYGASPGPAVFDLFLRLVSKHLAIAPPESVAKTKIDKQYTTFCNCDEGTPDDCCGPDVGELSFRDRFIGSQPYLIEPKDYFGVICCIVEKRYRPAKDKLAEAEAHLLKIDTEIKRLKALIENGPKTFEADAKGAIPTVIDCCDYEPKDDESHTTPSPLT